MSSARAWLFEEHSEIGLTASRRLPAAELDALQRLWTGLRLGPLGARLCPHAFQHTRAAVADCVDFAMLSAIAGDHACSPHLLMEVSGHDWMRAVIYEARHSARLLRSAATVEDKEDAWLDSHVRLQLVDKGYLDRAEATGAHFVPARFERELSVYLQRQLAPGAGSNAVALYTLYHAAALRLALEAPSSLQRDALLGKALFTEAFALHFLEDAFSAGHLVGSWGSPRQRMGTHDYYCQNGLVVQTWQELAQPGEEPAVGEYVAHGDGHLQPIDERAAAIAYAISLRQLLFAYQQGEGLKQSAAAAREATARAAERFVLAPDLLALQGQMSIAAAEKLHTYDACSSLTVPAELGALSTLVGLRYVLERTPRPVRIHETGDRGMAPPRFIRELGPFARFYAGTRFTGLAGGYGLDDTRIQAALEGGIGAGYGPEGIATRTSDGVFWASFSATGQTGQQSLTEDELPVRSRIGMGFRLRVPFAVVPGDALLATLLWPVAPEFAAEWLVYAARGGLLFQSVSVSSLGRLQLMLGRELGVMWLNKTEVTDYAERVGAVDIDLPILEDRPLRLNRDELTSAVTLQLGAGFQIPRRDDLGTSYFVYLRIGLDSRLYSFVE